MKIGDNVKHVNTGDKIHTIYKIYGSICTCILDKTMWKPIYKNSKNSPINDKMICSLDKLQKINNENNE